jgi:peptidoglycan/LPS O-acetylase OafA/YrhL
MILEQYFDVFKRWFEKPITRIGLIPMVLFLGNYPQYYSTAVDSSWYGWLPALSFAHTSSFYHGIAAICLLLLIHTTSMAQKIFSARLWLFLGKISFSLYLFHILVINTLTSWLFIQFLSVYPYGVSVFLSTLLSLPVILAGSLIIFNLTEKHTGTLYIFIRKWLIQ